MGLSSQNQVPRSFWRPWGRIISLPFPASGSYSTVLGSWPLPPSSDSATSGQVLPLPWLWLSIFLPPSSTTCVCVCVCVCACVYTYVWASQVALAVKNLPANAGDVRDEGLIPGSGRSLGGGHGNPLQYSSLENPMDKGAWLATIHRVPKSWT